LQQRKRKTERRFPGGVKEKRPGIFGEKNRGEKRSEGSHRQKGGKQKTGGLIGTIKTKKNLRTKEDQGSIEPQKTGCTKTAWQVGDHTSLGAGGKGRMCEHGPIHQFEVGETTSPTFPKA